MRRDQEQFSIFISFNRKCVPFCKFASYCSSVFFTGPCTSATGYLDLSKTPALTTPAPPSAVVAIASLISLGTLIVAVANQGFESLHG